MVSPLDAFAEDVYSQCGEDGIIAELFRRLGVESGRFCELGAWDGTYLSNTYRLVTEGWRGVMMEGDDEKFDALQATVADHPDRIVPRHAYVTPTGPDRLDAVLEGTELPTRFELLSIDIDGPDYHVWRSVEAYRPTVVVIEYNASLGPSVRFASDLRPNGRFRIDQGRTAYPPNFPPERAGDRVRIFGSSLRSLCDLACRKGYQPVCATRANLIAVRDDSLDALELPGVPYTSTDLFADEWLERTRPFYRRRLSFNLELLRDTVKRDGVIETVRRVWRDL